MPAGSNAKREREFEDLKKDFKKEHRYPGREDEVAARIVNKQRAEAGETKDAKKSAAKKSDKPAAKSGSGRPAAKKTAGKATVRKSTARKSTRAAKPR